MKKYIRHSIILLSLWAVFSHNCFAKAGCEVNFASKDVCMQAARQCAMDAGMAGMEGKITSDALNQYMSFMTELTDNSSGYGCSESTKQCQIYQVGACNMSTDPKNRFFMMVKDAWGKEVQSLRNFQSPAPYGRSAVTCTFHCENIEHGLCKNIPDPSTWTCAFNPMR